MGRPIVNAVDLSYSLIAGIAMITATIFETKMNLSAPVKKAQRGEVVVITSGKDRVPIAMLEAIRPFKKKRVGALRTPGFALTQAFFEPLPEEDLRL